MKEPLPPSTASADGALALRVGLTMETRSWLRDDGSRMTRPGGVGPDARLPGTFAAASTARAAEAGSSVRAYATLDASRDRLTLQKATMVARDGLLEAAQSAADASRRACLLADLLDEAIDALGDFRPGPFSASGTMDYSAPDVEGLSPRERDVLGQIAAGRSNKAIAEELFISPNTVKSHVGSLIRKLNVRSRTQLATFAVQHGLQSC